MAKIAITLIEVFASRKRSRNGLSRWFERLPAELGFELWIGDPAEIDAKRVRKPKTDREDARLLLRLMREDRFPRIWVPSPENRDLRHLLWHRHRLVQMRTRIMNQLQALAMNEGKRLKSKLWSGPGRVELERLALAPWASRRRQELLKLLDGLNPSIEEYIGLLLIEGFLCLYIRILVDVLLSNAGDRGYGRNGSRERAIAATARGSGFAKGPMSVCSQRLGKLPGSSSAFRRRTGGTCLAATARSGNTTE